MSSTLVTYFSAKGTTAKVGQEFAHMIDADIFEIVPVEPYTDADLKWVNPIARCNKEQLSSADVPVQGTINDFDKYDTIYIGFPIWYGAAPRVVYSFCKEYDWTGKKVYAFATSGGSGIGKTAAKLKTYVNDIESIDAKLVSTADEVKNW